MLSINKILYLIIFIFPGFQFRFKIIDLFIISSNYFQKYKNESKYFFIKLFFNKYKIYHDQIVQFTNK